MEQLCSNEKGDEVEAFFAKRRYPSIAMTLAESIEGIRIKARWLHNIRNDHSLPLLLTQLAATAPRK